MSEDKLSNDVFVSSLRQLLINCESLIRESDSVQTVQESLQRLEENDEHFYKYELVKVLKSQINDKLGRHIEETIEQYPVNRMDSNHAEMIDNMTSKLISSPEYMKLSKKLKTTVLNATEYLTNKYDSEIGSRLKQNNVGGTLLYKDGSSVGKDTSFKLLKNHSSSFKRSQQEAQAIFDDNQLFSIQSSDCESSSSSFFNPESCVFLNQEELTILAEDLDAKRKSFSKRQNAMTKLLKMPLVDIHCWDVLGSGLIDSLNEPELYNLAIKFIAKGLISTPNNVKALYCILARQLELLFTAKKYQLPALKSGIDIRQQDIQRILISMRLINEFQLNVIHFWVRYSEKFVEDIMDSTLKLFAISCKSLSLDSKLTPLHFLAIIDPKAEWMIKWTHGTYSRIPLLRLLERYKNILEDCINCCMRYFYVTTSNSDRISQYTEVEKAGSHCYFYSAAYLDYLLFIHSLCMIIRTVMYKSYSTLLQKILSKGDHTIQSFMCQLMVFGFNQPYDHSIKYGHLDPHHICFNILKNVAQDETSSINCFCNLEFLGEIFRFIIPLNNLENEELENYLEKYQNSLCQLTELLSEMIQYKSVRKLFITKPKTVLIPQSAVSLIGEIIHKNLSLHQALSNNLLSRLLFIFCQLYNGSIELYSIWSLGVHRDIVQAWKEAVDIKDRCITPTQEKKNNKIFEIDSWEDSLTNNMLLLAKTRRGVIFLEKNEAISCCCRGILAQIKSTQIQIEPSPIGNFDLLINQISSTKTGIETLVSMGYIQRILVDIWSITECDADDLASYHPRIWSTQGIDTTCLKPLAKLIAIYSSYSSLYTMIGGKQLPTEITYSFRDIPKSLIEFIDRLVMTNKPSKVQSLFNYESSHLCGLYWLSATITNLNSLLLLQSQYNFIDCMLEVQKQNINETSKEVIIDALSLERNNIIIKSSFLSGPSERHISSKRLMDTLEQDISSISLVNCLPVDTLFICPDCYKRNDCESLLHQHLKTIVENKLSNDLTIKEIVSLYMKDIRHGRTNYYTLAETMALLQLVICQLSESSQHCSQEDMCQTVNIQGKFSEYEIVGINMITNYGKNLKLFDDKISDEVDINLRSLLTNIKECMAKKSKIDIPKQEKLGFDWFAACIFMLCQGDYYKANTFLLTFMEMEQFDTIWPMNNFVFNNSNQFLCYICHWVELIVATESPAVYSSFQICGYPISEVCSMWLSQCFLNIFNWPDVVIFLTTSILMGKTFVIYFCVALLNHMEPEIKARLHNNDLIIFIREVVIEDFRLCDNIEEILKYRETYELMINEDFKNV